MPDSPLVCFCTEKTEKEVKDHIRKGMDISSKVDNDLVFKIHKSFENGNCMGRCLGCIDEVEGLMDSFKQGKWS